MRDCIGIIISGRYGQPVKDRFGALSENRPDYMLPFAGRYRIIDFALSSLSNYNLYKVMLYAGDNIRSTLDHIGDGKSWELNRRNNGLFINPPVYNSLNQINPIQVFNDSISFYEETSAPYVHIMNPMIISKTDMSEAFDEFKENDYDVQLFYKDVNDEEGKYANMRKLILDESGKFINVGMNLGTNKKFSLYLDRLFIKKELFIKLVRQSLENGDATTLIQAISNYKSRLKIGVYKVETPIMLVDDINSYYDANMGLLNSETYDELFFRDGMVYTKSKDEPSALYDNDASVQNSLVANGCNIDGRVENSILSRGVQIHKNAIVRNCILNEKTIVKENAVLVNVITDKKAVIEAGVTLAGAQVQPYVIAKDEIVSR